MDEKVSLDAFKRLLRFYLKRGDECPICFEESKLGLIPVECYQKDICPPCWYQCLTKNNKCPFCRATIIEKPKKTDDDCEFDFDVKVSDDESDENVD